MGIFSFVEFELWQWLVIIGVALLVGFARAGIHTVVMLGVPLMAMTVEGKGATGMMVSMFVVGDVIAVLYYKQHADWKIVKRLAPWVILGVSAGLFIGRYINNEQFTMIVSISVLICLALMIYGEVRKGNLAIPKKMWVHGLTGTACGFTSMIGNVAAPIFNIYLISMGFNKQNFIGTAAMFFFMTNLIKLPLQVFFWHNITSGILGVVLLMVPVILVGFIVGTRVIKILNENIFRHIVLAMTAIACIKLLI